MKFDIDLPAGSSSALPRERTGSLAGNPERLAWLVIFGAFLACIFLGITLPLSGYNFVLYAMEARTSTVEAISPIPNRCGTVRLLPPNSTQASAVTCDSKVTFAEGSTIKTDASSRAFEIFRVEVGGYESNRAG